LKRLFFLLLGLAALVPAPALMQPPAAGEFVQAVEFPYYLYPRAQWERELVWMKTIGVRTVEFSIPWNWHQIGPGDFDFTGRTSPRRDLVGLIRLLRRLDLRAWVKPLPPVHGWINNGWLAPGPDARAQRAWLDELERMLATQTERHGGPIAFVEGRGLSIDAIAPPSPVAAISANDPAALARSRETLASAHGALVWEEVEDQLYPAGWEPVSGAVLRKGAVDLSGDERVGTSALRRDAALLRGWSAILPEMRVVPVPKPLSGRWPSGISVAELVAPQASAVSITNRGAKPFQGELRVAEPESRRVLAIPTVTVPPGESLWLPLSVAIGGGGLCKECTNFSGVERIVYATAELTAIEFENGILAMEFAAPEPGEVVLQLVREPEGPFLAAGKPTEFSWDEKTLRARLPVPASKEAGNRVRIGLAIEAPDTSAFFGDSSLSDIRRLIIGRKNIVPTTYSSPEVAARSRLRLPEGFTGTPTLKSPNEIEYAVDVPAEALHGDWANLAIETDGVPLGRARLQLFRPASIRMSEAIRLHFGQQTELAVEPPTASVDPKAGRNLEIVIRNNSPEIQTYQLEASGEGLEFFPAQTEISIGAVMERSVNLRVFASDDNAAGIRDWRLRVRGGANVDIPMRAVLTPRGATVVWSADLDGDGYPEWVLESQKVRAVFSAQDGGRWMELTWKDSGANFLPEAGAFAGAGPVAVRAAGETLEFSGRDWKRIARLTENALTIEQNTPLPADRLAPEKRGNTSLSITRASASRATYKLE
jgi:Glycosyl hydrolases family 35